MMGIKEQIEWLRHGDIEDLPSVCNHLADTLEKLLAVYEAAKKLKEHELMKNNPYFKHHQELRDAIAAVQKTEQVDDD